MHGRFLNVHLPLRSEASIAAAVAQGARSRLGHLSRERGEYVNFLEEWDG